MRHNTAIIINNKFAVAPFFSLKNFMSGFAYVRANCIDEFSFRFFSLSLSLSLQRVIKKSSSEFISFINRKILSSAWHLSHEASHLSRVINFSKRNSFLLAHGWFYDGTHMALVAIHFKFVFYENFMHFWINLWIELKWIYKTLKLSKWGKR